MKVRYVRERGYKGAGQDPHLTLGKVYTVFQIDFRPDSGNYPAHISLLSDSKDELSMWEIGSFEFVDERVPEDWVFLDFGKSYFRLCPKEFTGDFWDSFHEGDENAEQVFEAVKARLASVGRE